MFLIKIRKLRILFDCHYWSNYMTEANLSETDLRNTGIYFQEEKCYIEWVFTFVYNTALYCLKI